MKEIFVLDKIVLTEATKGKGLRVEFIPKKDVYCKNVKLVFSGDNVTQVLENFDMPVRVGDTIEVDLMPKQTQGKLPVDEEDGVKDKGPAKKTGRTTG